MDVFGPRMLAYSSDGPKLHLDTEPFAYSDIRIALGSAAGEWDYVTFEDPDGERQSWEWARGRRSLSFRVGRPGRYKLRYLIDGGYLTVGTVAESLDVAVRSPVRSFVVDRQVYADSAINVCWELEFVPAGCMFVFRCDRIRLAERAISSNVGSASIPAPRAAGEFSVTLQGTNSRDSQISEQPVTVTIGNRPFSLQLRRMGDNSDESHCNAIVTAPGAEVEVAWAGELVDSVDAIVIAPSERGSLSNILESLRCDHPPSARGGRRTFAAPRDVGLYSVVYGVRYNHVTIPAALAHLAVSDRLAPSAEWLPLAHPNGDDMTVLLSGRSGAEVSSERGEGGEGGLAHVLSSLLGPMMHAPVPGEGVSAEPPRRRGGAGEHEIEYNGSVTGDRRQDKEAGAHTRRRTEEEEEEEEEEGGEVQQARRRERGAAVEDEGARGGAKSRRGGGVSREVLCVVCLDSSVCVLLRPCNHAVLCEQCARSIKVCPMDRRSIEGRERIFMCQ